MKLDYDLLYIQFTELLTSFTEEQLEEWLINNPE